jgi:hypothetical protein
LFNDRQFIAFQKLETAAPLKETRVVSERVVTELFFAPVNPLFLNDHA